MSPYLEQFNHQFIGPESGRRWVFLHGLMGAGINWRRIANGLAETERIFLYDQRGHGKSIKPETGYAPSDYADDLNRLTDELGWDKFILVGHSMGGRNALQFAHQYPQKLERLVIEDFGPEGDPSAADYYRKLLEMVPTPFADKKAAKEFFANEFLVKAQHMQQPRTLGAYLYTNIIETESGQADWRFRPEAIISTVVQGRAKNQWDELRQLTMPTLIVRGETSRELSRSVYDRMLVANPNVTGVEISNAGHWVHSDQPDEFIRVLKEFSGL